MGNTKETKTINLPLPIELHRRLKALAALRDVTLTEMVTIVLAENVSEITTKRAGGK